MKFSEKIVRLRKIKGLTQDEFANAVGVSRQAVYKWESGQSYPEVTKLLEIKMLFEISIDDLLDESYEVELPEKKHRVRKAAPVVKKEEILPKKEENIQDNSQEVFSYTEDKNEVKEEEPVKPQKENEKEIPKTDNITNGSEGIDKNENEMNAVGEVTRKVGFFGRIFGRK